MHTIFASKKAVCSGCQTKIIVRLIINLWCIKESGLENMLSSVKCFQKELNNLIAPLRLAGVYLESLVA
jgi:hypothetical protein